MPLLIFPYQELAFWWSPSHLAISKVTISPLHDELIVVISVRRWAAVRVMEQSLNHLYVRL